MGTAYGPFWESYSSFRVAPSGTPRVLIQAESGSFEASNQYHTQRIDINGTNVVNSDAPRSYRITKIVYSSGSWTVTSNGYDVYGSSSEAVSARNFLNGFSYGDILVLNTWDEPLNNFTYDDGGGSISSVLTANFKSKISTYSRSFRDMHLLVAAQGKGVIYEEYRSRYSDSISFSGWLR